MKNTLCLAFLFTLLCPAWSQQPSKPGAADFPTPSASATHQERIPLRKRQVTVETGKPEQSPAMDHDRAFYTVYKPANPNGAAVVICPGGGYGGLVTGAEGRGIAKWLNNHGIMGIVLEYRLPNGRSMVPLLDAQRAIRTVRFHAKKWGGAPNRIGIIGFSAGGHLASTAATHFDSGSDEASDPIERMSCRPDFAILVYPVITMGEETHSGSKRNLLGLKPTTEDVEYFSNERQITADTPPTYLTHAVDDKVVSCENSRMFHRTLKANEVATEYLEVPSGGHGLNGYKGPMWDAWQAGAIAWLKARGMMAE